MQYALSRPALEILAMLFRERTLYAFDFDGTLSPIVDHPELAGMGARTRDLLARLAAERPCVVVSGRARADLLGRLDGVNVRAIGNHGAETEDSSGAPYQVAQWKAALELAVGPLDCVLVEDKGLSLAVHYRHAADPHSARRRILWAACRLKDVRVFGGKCVVNLVPYNASHKGEALAAERERLGCDWVLYVGDDETDEDAFALGGNTVPVRIGRKEHSHARYYLRAQTEINRFLEALLGNDCVPEQVLRTPVPVSRATPVDRR